MKKCASDTVEAARSAPASLALRSAQRAYAAALDAERVGEFRIAQLRKVARRTLSALSADDRARLTEWLTLQLATAGRGLEDVAQRLLARIDGRIAAHVRRALPARVEALAVRAGANHIVAA